jgi:hypothetical protein
MFRKTLLLLLVCSLSIRAENEPAQAKSTIIKIGTEHPRRTKHRIIYKDDKITSEETITVHYGETPRNKKRNALINLAVEVGAIVASVLTFNLIVNCFWRK